MNHRTLISESLRAARLQKICGHGGVVRQERLFRAFIAVARQCLCCLGTIPFGQITVAKCEVLGVELGRKSGMYGPWT